MHSNSCNWWLFETQMVQKTQWPVWQGIGPVMLGPGFNSHQSFGQWLKFLANLTNWLGRYLGKTQMICITVNLGQLVKNSCQLPTEMMVNEDVISTTKISVTISFWFPRVIFSLSFQCIFKLTELWGSLWCRSKSNIYCTFAVFTWNNNLLFFCGFCRDCNFQLFVS